MDRQNKQSKQIRWKSHTPLQLQMNSEDILKYFAGKLDLQSQTTKQIQDIIASYNLSEIDFYYHFLSHFLLWKVFWYFSPLHRNAQQILIHIAPIQFTYLNRIVINQSSIYSIEPIAFLDCPFLKQIDIQQNYITSLKPLAKTNFPSLIVLKFYYNNFNHDQSQHINRTLWKNFHPMGLYHFWKETFYDQFFKLQPNMLKKIFVQRPKGSQFSNLKTIQKLKQKFIVEQFYVHFSKY